MTTRILCPLDCGWHHDVEDPTLNPATATMPLPTPDLAYMLGLGRLHAVEGILRAHLETHQLIEWVQALQVAKQRIGELERSAQELLPQVMELHRLAGRIIDEAQRERWQAAGRCGVCGFDGDRTRCQDCDGGRS